MGWGEDEWDSRGKRKKEEQEMGGQDKVGEADDGRARGEADQTSMGGGERKKGEGKEGREGKRKGNSDHCEEGEEGEGTAWDEGRRE